MARQDLLDERRSRARHADDKHRLLRWKTPIFARSYELAAKRALRQLERSEGCGFFVVDRCALQLVCKQELCKTAVALSDVRVGFRECKSYARSLFPVQPGLRKGFQLRKTLASGLGPLDRNEPAQE